MKKLEREYQLEPSLKKYLVSIGVVFFFTLIQFILWPFIGPAPFLLFFPAVIISSIHGDGNLSIMLSAVLGQYFFIPPFGLFAMSWPQDYVRFGTFLVTAFMIKKIIRNEVIAKIKAQKSEALSLERERDLKKSQVARDRFVSMLNHDLRNPLTPIKLSSELILKKPENVELVQKHVHKQISNILRMEEMIHDLLDANKIQAGHPLQLKFEDCEIDQVIREVVNDLALLYGDRFIVEGSGADKGQWNPSAIRRIIDNLATNAVKYGKQNAPISIGHKKQEEGVLVWVKNEGNPIPKGDIEKLFDPYQQLSRTKDQGWGIGLTLVKGLIEAHRGHLTVESNLEGTVYSFILPFNPSQIRVP